MASPRKLAAKLCSLSPRSVQNTTQFRQFLCPKTPIRGVSEKKENECLLSPFSIDTPNRTKILKNGLSSRHHEVLGCGGFGTVYKASYKGDNVAAKIVQTRKYTNEMINSEKQASLLKHSNIVRILTIEQGASLSLIAMELCGTNLQDRLEEAPLSKNEKICILRDITYALQFCHKAGIVHADVKPKNILIAADGQPKLTDFGSSVSMAETHETFELCGTPGYTAPEVLMGHKPTPAADIYSLGIVAWQMISRRLPFDGLHAHTIIYLSAKGRRPKDDNIEDNFNGKYKILYREMWSQNITDRPKCNEIIDKANDLICQ